MDKNSANQIIKLSQNENPLGASPKAMEAIINSVNKSSLYPEPHAQNLTAKIAVKLGVDSKNIFVSAGLIESLDIFIRNFVGGGNMIIGEITFVAYHILAKVFRIKTKIAVLKDFKMDVDEILKNYDSNTRLIIIANPNNPTGTYLTHNEVERLLNISNNTIVILDEAYYEYHTESNFPHALALQKKYNNLVIMRTFSKIYGLAGLRIGYTIAHEDIIAKLSYYQPPFTVSSVGCSAAIAALNDVDFVNKSASMNADERPFLTKELERIGYQVVTSQSNFIYVRFKNSLERNELYDVITKNGVLVRKTDLFGDNHSFRITIGTPENNRKILNLIHQANITGHH